MKTLLQIFEQLALMGRSPEMVAFVQDDLLRLVLVGLAFGFAVLLVEIRLPLKYYWDLPVFALRRFLTNLGLRQKTPVWGYCQDVDTHAIIPLTAVELLDVNSKKVLQTAYSNHLGQYGFNAPLGTYILRAVKNYYQMPPFYDPENIQLVRVDESYAAEVNVQEGKTPDINLPLQKIKQPDPLDPKNQAWHFFKTFSLNLANGFLALSVLGSSYGWAITREPLHGVLIAVGIALLFVKIYILEAVGQAAG